MKHSHRYDFEALLRNNGLKSTPLRIQILKIIGRRQGPISAEELAQGLTNFTYDRATLFRTLKTFSQKEILNPIDLGEGFLRYEYNCLAHHHHHHIICRKCKKIEILPFCIPDSFKKILSQKGYQHITHRLDFSALCKKCA